MELPHTKDHTREPYSIHFETITSEHSNLRIILCPKFGLDQLVKNVIEKHLSLFGVVPYNVYLKLLKETCRLIKLRIGPLPVYSIKIKCCANMKKAWALIYLSSPALLASSLARKAANGHLRVRNYEKIIGFPFRKSPLWIGYRKLFPCQKAGFPTAFWVSRKAGNPVISHPAFAWTNGWTDKQMLPNLVFGHWGGLFLKNVLLPLWRFQEFWDISN